MKKIIRYLLTGLVAAIVFLVASVAIFIAVFDANAYKQDLSDLVREQTGRELQFYGDVELTLYPSLGMKLGAMSLSNAEGFAALPMVKVGQASISVDVASLVSFAPEVDKLVLRNLEINLMTNKAGVTNWDDLMQPSAPAAPAAGSATDQTPPVEAESGTDFELRGAFAGLDLENVKLLWLDEQAGSRFEIIDLDISTGRIEPDQPFDLALHLDASANGDLDVVFDLRTRVGYLIEQQQLSLDDLVLALNEFELGGSLQLSDFARPTPRLRFDLSSQNLDVDALLGTPPAPAPGSEPEQQAAASASEDVKIELPMQTLRDLDIDGQLRIAQIKVQNLQLQDVAIAVNAQNGLVGLKPLTLGMYGGKVDSTIVIDVNSAIPKYAIDESVQSVRVGDLLKDYIGEERISGNFDAAVKLTTSGEWLSELKQNSNGDLKLAFADGSLKGFNLRQSIESAKARLRGDAPPPKQEFKTDFSSLTLSGVIVNGVFSSDDLDLQAPLLRVGGKGSANLNTEEVDYLVNAKLVGSVEGQQGETADHLAGLTIPVGIKGPFAGPEIDVLLDEMLKAKADAEKQKLREEIDAQKLKLKQQLEAEKQKLEASKKVEQLKDKAKSKLEDKLKNLFD